MENASNISQEEVIYKFYHEDGENRDLPMLGAQTRVKDKKPVKAILERTPNFPRSSEGSEPPRLRMVFKRNQPFENQVITQVATREAIEEVYRQAGIETSRQSDVVEAMEQSTETLLSIDTVPGEILKREQIELGSLITKIRKVTAPVQVTPGTSGVPSQTEKDELIDLMNTGDTSDKEMLEDTGPGPMIKVKQAMINEYFTGLTNHDSDDNDFSSEVIICESDDSEEDNNNDHDADQIKMWHIYVKHKRNRYRKQVSEVDSQIKTEPDDTEDTGDQNIQHTSLETVESLAALCTEDTGEHSTIPQFLGASQQSEEGEESQQINKGLKGHQFPKE